MKKSYITLIASVLFFALSACGGSAHAGSLTHNFVSDDGKVFQVDNALSVEKVTGAVQVVAANGTTYSYADSTGFLFNKILASTSFASHYIQVGSSLLYMNTTASLYIICYSNQTAFAYAGPIPIRTFPDGCAALNVIKSQSN